MQSVSSISERLTLHPHPCLCCKLFSSLCLQHKRKVGKNGRQQLPLFNSASAPWRALVSTGPFGGNILPFGFCRGSQGWAFPNHNQGKG